MLIIYYLCNKITKIKRNMQENKKKLLEKIYTPCMPLSPTDLSADEKKLLYALMASLGATNGFTYNRFFKEGFSQWEIDGIIALKTAFIKWLQTEEKLFIEIRNVGGNKWMHFYRIPPKATEGQSFEEHSFDITKPGDFWRFILDISYCRKFAKFMEDRGLKSYLTVSKRFSADDWKEWELEGMRMVMERFFQNDAP